MEFHIIDDEAAVRKILKAFIEYAGHQTRCFDGAGTYLEHFSSPHYTPPVAILTDYMMPGINGYELAMRIRQRAPYQKIMVVSGMADPEHEGNMELCYTLRKPFTRESVISLVRAIAACENACTAGIRCYAHRMCESGLAHPCPFVPSG